MLLGIWYAAMVAWLIAIWMIGSGHFEPMLWITLLVALALSAIAMTSARRVRQRRLAALNAQFEAGLISADAYREQKRQIDAPTLAQPF